MAKELSLREWIDKRGVYEVADDLKVVPSTVWHWRRGFCLPTYSKLHKIVELSKGAVTIERMTKDFFAVTNKPNRAK